MRATPLTGAGPDGFHPTLSGKGIAPSQINSNKQSHSQRNWTERRGPCSDITKLPENDAGGSELLTTYYDDGQAATQSQRELPTKAEETLGYHLDPAGRTRETLATGSKPANATYHYAGPGNSPAWSENTSGEFSRNIPGIDGALVAIQYNSEPPVLQLTNLHGDLIATAAISPEVTKLLSSADTGEYGVPTTEAPPKYSWLGSIEIPTLFQSGVTEMGPRSYIPQLGRFLQPDPIAGGSANAYAYTYGDPVNTSDPSGEYTIGGPSGALIGGTAQTADEGAANQAAINAAAKREAECQARGFSSCEAQESWEIDEATNARLREGARAALGQTSWEEEGYYEEWEEWEEEGEYGYASYHNEWNGEGADPEPAVLYQPLGEGAPSGDGGGETPSANEGPRRLVSLGPSAPACIAHSQGPCVRGVSGGICQPCYPHEHGHEHRHHSGGGSSHKSCPPGYHKIPVVELCIKFEWPSGPSPIPLPPLPPIPAVP